MSLSSTKSTRKHPKFPSVLDCMDSDDDEDDLLLGSPAFRPKTLSSNDATKGEEETAPLRRSPRRSSIATLDGGTSSPSLTFQSSQGTSNAASPSNKLVIMDEDDKSKSSPPSQKKKKSKKDRLMKNDVDVVVPTEHEQTSSFTLTKLANSVLHESTANERRDRKSSEITKPQKKSKLAPKDATAGHDPTQSNADQTGTSTKGAIAAARVSMSNEKKPRESSTKRTTSPSVLMSSDLAVEELAPSEKAKKTKKKKSKKSDASVAAASTAATASKENTVNTSQPAPAKKSKKTSNAAVQEAGKIDQAATLTKKTKKVEKAATKAEPTQQASSAALESPPKANPTETKTAPQSASTENSGTTTTTTTADDKPKKKKKKKLNPQDSVFQHLFLAMRPFNTKDLLAQLKNVSETELNFIMLSLIDKGLVAKKDFTSSKGRTKTLYWAVDGVVCKEVAATHMASLTERNSAKQKCQSMAMELMSLQKTMAEIQSDLSNDEINRRLKEEEQRWKDLHQKVAEIKARMQAPPPKPKLGLASKAPPKAPASPNNLKRRINHMRDEWKGRKAKVHDFVEQLSDAMEKKPKEVFKLLDLETDEMCGVTLPPKYEVEEPVAKKKRY
eukprot:scaffold2243_cov165-Amphora_coffeaeformis.AAC.13